EINAVPRTFTSGDRFTGVQAGIAIPLFFQSYTSKIKAAKIKEQVSKTNAENYSKSLLGAYRSLLGDYAKYNNSLEYYEKQAIPEADLIIDQATKSYKAGAMDYLDYVQSLSRAFDIKQKYLEALNNYNQTIISIEFISGKVN
ncbi:MAG: TolC family protein, partial [Paludibacter sp.]